MAHFSSVDLSYNQWTYRHSSQRSSLVVVRDKTFVKKVFRNLYFLSDNKIKFLFQGMLFDVITYRNIGNQSNNADVNDSRCSFEKNRVPMHFLFGHHSDDFGIFNSFLTVSLRQLGPSAGFNETFLYLGLPQKSIYKVIINFNTTFLFFRNIITEVYFLDSTFI